MTLLQLLRPCCYTYRHRTVKANWWCASLFFIEKVYIFLFYTVTLSERVSSRYIPCCMSSGKRHTQRAGVCVWIHLHIDRATNGYISVWHFLTRWKWITPKNRHDSHLQSSLARTHILHMHSLSSLQYLLFSTLFSSVTQIWAFFSSSLSLPPPPPPPPTPPFPGSTDHSCNRGVNHTTLSGKLVPELRVLNHWRS